MVAPLNLYGITRFFWQGGGRGTEKMGKHLLQDRHVTVLAQKRRFLRLTCLFFYADLCHLQCQHERSQGWSIFSVPLRRYLHPAIFFAHFHADLGTRPLARREPHPNSKQIAPKNGSAVLEGLNLVPSYLSPKRECGSYS